jgi:hypothetical protein
MGKFRLQRNLRFFRNGSILYIMKTVGSAAGGKAQFPVIAALEREADVLRAAVDVLRAYLPSTWTLEVNIPGPSRLVDAELRLRAPDGREMVALIEAKRLLNTRDVPVVVGRLRQAASTTAEGEVALLLVARYLAPATRERIIESGAGYIDVTGNLYLAGDRPALLLRDRGADKDPWRGPGRPRGTLNGPPAARVVRALIDFAPPYSVPELAERAGASTGATYRVVEFLEEQRLLERAERGPITSVNWRAVLERWSTDYGFAQSNTVETFLEPRGISAIRDRLRDVTDFEYALTGSMAAEGVAPYAPTRLAMIYVRDIKSVAKSLGLRATGTGANVALAAGEYDVALERVRLVDGLRYAALSQVAVDLLNGPGRNPSEALALIDWMERNEPAWRQ